MYESFGVAACRFFVRQVRISHIGSLIVIPFNGELIYRHLDVALLSVRDAAAPAALGDRRGLCDRAAHDLGRLRGGPGHKYQSLACHQALTR